MHAKIHLSPVGSGASFSPKTFVFDRPMTLELDGFVRGLCSPPIPASENAIFPSLALAIDQAFIHYDGSSFSLQSVEGHSDSVCVNGLLLGDRVYALCDGDQIEFGEYREQGHSFKVDCAVLVRLSLTSSPVPVPTTTNWPGVHKLIHDIRHDQAQHRSSKQPDSGNPSRHHQTSASALSTSPATFPPLAPAAPEEAEAGTFEEIMLALRAMRAEQDIKLRQELALVPASVRPAILTPSCVTTPTSTSHSAPALSAAVSTSVSASVLGTSSSNASAISFSVPASASPFLAAPPVSTPYGAMVKEMQLRSNATPDKTPAAPGSISLSFPVIEKPATTPVLKSTREAIPSTFTAAKPRPPSGTLSVHSAVTALSRVRLAWMQLRCDVLGLSLSRPAPGTDIASHSHDWIDDGSQDVLPTNDTEPFAQDLHCPGSAEIAMSRVGAAWLDVARSPHSHHTTEPHALAHPPGPSSHSSLPFRSHPLAPSLSITALAQYLLNLIASPPLAHPHAYTNNYHPHLPLPFLPPPYSAFVPVSIR